MRNISNGKIKAEYFKYEHRSSNDPRFYPSGNNSHYIKPVDGEYTVYKQVQDSIVASFVIDFGELAINPIKVNELRASKERNAYLKSEYFKSISNILETENYLYFNCVGPSSFAYEGIINKKNNEVRFGRWDYKKSPVFFYSDGVYLYGFYEPYKIIEKDSNGENLNTCFDKVFNGLENVEISDNFILVKVLLK